MQNGLKVGLLLILLAVPFGGVLQSQGAALDHVADENEAEDVVLSAPSPANRIITMADEFYADFTEGKASSFPNENMARMHRFAISYNQISRARFKRVATQLESQRDIPELIDYVLQGAWFDEMARMTGDPIYGYSENRALRILISSQVAASSFDIPYPTLFCLLFQESQFDFKVRSHTGALGLGQLTGIAVKQLQINRKNPDVERKLQATVAQLGAVYRDPVLIEVMQRMGFHPKFPLIPKFPKNIQAGQKIDDEFVRGIMQELVEQGHPFGREAGLVRKLAHQISRGILLPTKYAAMHPIYLQELSRSRSVLGNTLNVETNMLLSAMLLRYYMDYPWKVGKRAVKLMPEVQAMVAVAAYNQGPQGVLRYFSHFKHNHPSRDLSKMDLEDFRPTFTKAHVASALRQSSAQTREVYEHVWKVKQCGHDQITRLASEK
jgi:hypothetical protein